MEVSGGPVGQNRSGTASQNGCHQMPFPGEEAVANAVDALLNAMQASGVSSLSCQIPIQVRQLP